MLNGSSNCGRLTSFDEIEEEKENILPLREGRSARELLQGLNQDESQLNTTRISFERRLLEELEDMDDPLELFMEYITWINHAYPQGGSSKKSGMLDVLERCLMYFRDIETYKNDPRLLKVWLWYIESFAADSEQESRDIFVYMLRKRIGSKLSLFYESFAASLFDMGKFKEAHIILKMGVDESARPHNRLSKKLEEYETRLRSMNIDMNGEGSTDHRFLESSNDLILGRERSFLMRVTQGDGHRNDHWGDRDAKTTKYDIFRDDGSSNAVNEPLHTEGWDLLDFRANRSKENKMASTKLTIGSNLGKLNQETGYQERQAASEKLPIFKDSLGRSEPVYKIVEVPGKKPEKIDCNFNLIYPSNNEEFCIEEVLAISRKVYHQTRKLSDTALSQDETPIVKRRKKSGPLIEKRAKLPSSQPPLPHAVEISHSDHSVDRDITEDHEHVQTVQSTSILPLRNSQEDDHTDHQKIEGLVQTPHSPTITYFSKNAMEEVYSMFNQHYHEPKPAIDRDETTGRFGLENVTQDYTRQNLEDLTEVKRVDADGNTKTGEFYVEAIDKKTVVSPHSERNAAESPCETFRTKGHEFMTPIQESNEKLVERSSKGQNSQENDKDVEGSSPFLTQPQLMPEPNKEEKALIIEDPLSSTLRVHLLANIQPPLDDYETFFRYNQSLKMSTLLKRIHRVSKSENKNPIVDFKKTNDLYCIRAELGEGGYATVYLAESSIGGLKALKVEKPASMWEFYILKQVEKKLKGEEVLRSIINASSLHCFQDESYLVLNYANQGTVLDLVNLQKEKSKGPIDELLCMFITIELMKVVEAIHSVGIIHGDLKPDNCMIRFESGNLGPYQADGSEGWSKKGIYLIDFGRSFDMSLFQPGAKFKANWKTDQQDCFEMRKGKPWSYEADYFGLAGIIHSLLFGEFIDTIQDFSGRIRLRSSFKRYWQQDIWSSIFDALMNSSSFETFPITAKLIEKRLQIETYLTNHSNDTLRCIIRDLELELTQAKRGTKFSK